MAQQAWRLWSTWWQTQPARWLPVILILSMCLAFITTSPASAFSIDDYFTFSYSMQLSQTEVQGSQVFYITVSGQATCIEDLLGLTPSAAYITSRIMARHSDTGAEVTLHPSYTLNIEPFPGKGETVEETVVVPLTFPPGSMSGTYTIIGEVVEAKVQAGIWLTVTSYLPPSQEIGTVTYQESDSSNGSDGGDGDSTTEEAPDGELTTESTDGRATLTVAQGTTALTTAGGPLNELTITEMDEPPPAPTNAEIVSPVYDFGPDGATFDQPVRIRLGYDQSLIPEGIAERQLTAAVWDGQLEEWLPLESTVDPVNDTVTTEVTHFTPYTVIASTRPAAFSVSGLTITPGTAGMQQTITIKVLVSNTGDLAGTYLVALKIDGTTTAVQQLPLNGDTSRTVVFTTSHDTPGIYEVEIDTLSGTFTVEATSLPPTPVAFITSRLTVAPGKVSSREDVTISVLVTNTGDFASTHRVELEINGVVTAFQDVSLEGSSSQTVVFITSQDRPGVYDVSIDNMTDSFAVEEKEIPLVAEDLKALQVPLGMPFNWGLVGGISAGVVTLLAVLAFLLLRRRRA
ncbi:MAG TPA: hypothetical protein VMW13_00430 [Dehalococcoidales bacterium]|nr:hypothetical protein [Dehalococcoidales bacterium]